jgi:hypothetical protein
MIAQRFTLDICFGTGAALRWVTLASGYLTAEDAHWAAAQWRQQWGRPTDQGDPFRVLAEPLTADQKLLARLQNTTPNGETT